MAEMTDIALEGRQDQPKEYPVLWWTLWFGETVEEGRIIDKCGLPYTCKFTLDRTKYDDAKVIVVHASSFEFDFPYVNDVKSGKKALVLNTGKQHCKKKGFGLYYLQCLFRSSINNMAFFFALINTSRVPT
jgi:hypothetical protein